MAQEARPAAPLFVAVAPTGARRTRADHPHLPITPEEIAREARACLDAGAAMLHLHVRDARGAHTLEAAAYRAAIAAVGAACGDGLVIQVTTEATGRFTPAEQMACVRELRPEAVSLAIRELVPDASHEAEAARFLAWCRRERIETQYILYDVADLERLDDLSGRGVIPERRPSRLYVLGRYAPRRPADPAELLPILARDGGREAPWTVCAFGPRELACVTTAAALGGHVRVGFENNLHLPDGSLAGSNAALVAGVVNLAAAIGRAVGNAEALRADMAARR